MSLTASDVYEQRLSEARPLAVSSTEGGLQLPAARGDEDDAWRARMVDRLNRAHGLRRTTWPAATGPHRRCAADERFGLRGGL